MKDASQHSLPNAKATSEKERMRSGREQGWVLQVVGSVDWKIKNWSL